MYERRYYSSIQSGDIYNLSLQIQVEKSQGEIYRLRAKLESTQTENENLQDEMEKMQQALNRSYSDRDKIVSDLDKIREDLERSQVSLISRPVLGKPFNLILACCFGGRPPPESTNCSRRRRSRPWRRPRMTSTGYRRSSRGHRTTPGG